MNSMSKNSFEKEKPHSLNNISEDQEKNIRPNVSGDGTLTLNFSEKLLNNGIIDFIVYQII